ncbi:hypothetical protein [Streptomyces hirsutus]|uniref:hypothetical protein n=1 Tax=Streptomyces hirsutus TaxID=35620 RepID=UPI0006E446C7|nr:hypothetical protein [Streptomyces hirsutus]
MAGTDEEAAAADDALYVLTAALLTPAKFPSVLGDDYPEACAALGLPPLADGYGLVLGQDGEGARWTVAIDDVSLVAVAIASWDCGMEHDLSPEEHTVVAALPGWPLSVAVAAPNVPAPHDPGPEVTDGPVLAPPDSGAWGPAQRRLGADEIALRWALWRDQVDDSAFPVPGGSVESSAGAGDAAGDGSAHGGPADEKPTGESTTVEEQSGDAPSDDGAPSDDPNGRRTGHSGIRRVLAEARAYVSSPPPLGRVRSSFAPGDARTLRADGPGWSLVARTDDMAFVLLDDEPGEVLPVGRGPELPGLLEGLDRIAVRPL